MSEFPTPDEVMQWEELPPDVEPTSWEKWTVATDSHANWILRKLRTISTEVDRLDAARAAEVKRISDWHSVRTKKLADDAFYYGQRIEDYYRRLSAEADANEQKMPSTYHLPDGSIVARKSPSKLEVTNGAAFCAWALAEGRFDLVMTTPAKTAIKTDPTIALGEDNPFGHERDLVATDTGERVPGVVMVEGHKVISAKPNASATGAEL